MAWPRLILDALAERLRPTRPDVHLWRANQLGSR